MHHTIMGWLPHTSLLIVMVAISQQSEQEGHLEDLFKKLVKPDKTLVLIYDQYNKEFFPLLKLKNPKIVINFKQYIRHSLPEYSIYVICTKSNRGLKYLLYRLSSSKIWNPSNSPRTQFLIISAESNTKEMSEIFRKYKITHVIQLKRLKGSSLPPANSSRHMIFKRHNKASKYKTLKKVVEVPKIRHIVVKVLYTKGMINRDPYYNFLVGILTKDIKIIGRAINATTKIYLDRVCTTFDNNPRTLCLTMVYTQRESTIANSYFDISEPIYIDLFTWAARRIKDINYHQSMLFVFNWDASLMLLFVFTLIVLKSWVVSLLLKEYSEFHRIQTWMLVTAQLMLSVPSSPFPRKTTLRILFMFYMFYCLQISNWFQARMTSVLIDPPTEPEMKTFQQLYQSPLPLYVVPWQKRLFSYYYPDMYNQVESKLITEPNIGNTTERLEYCAKHHCSLLINHNFLIYHSPQFLSKFYIFKYDNLGDSSISFYIDRGHYFLTKLNCFHRTMFEAGISENILVDIKQKKQQKPLIVDDAKVEDNIYLQMKHLKEVFLLLVVGLSIATIIFLCEMIYQCFRKR